MAYIKVNHQDLLSAASEIDEYIKKLDNNMKQIDTTMVSLQSSWNGTDYFRVKTKWDEINSNGSTTEIMRTNLNNLAIGMREAAKRYKRAQMSAADQAEELCLYKK